MPSPFLHPGNARMVAAAPPPWPSTMLSQNPRKVNARASLVVYPQNLKAYSPPPPPTAEAAQAADNSSFPPPEQEKPLSKKEASLLFYEPPVQFRHMLTLPKMQQQNKKKNKTNVNTTKKQLESSISKKQLESSISKKQLESSISSSSTNSSTSSSDTSTASIYASSMSDDEPCPQKTARTTTPVEIVPVVDLDVAAATAAAAPPPTTKPSKKARRLSAFLKKSLRSASVGIIKQSSGATTAKAKKEEEQDKEKKKKRLPETGFFSNNHIMMNRERAIVGTKPLHRSRYLDFLALSHAVDLAMDCQVEHSVELLPDLQDLLNCAVVGENVQRGTTIREMHAEAMKSQDDTRRRNILRDAYTEFGMATSLGKDGKLYMVQLFRGKQEKSEHDDDGEKEESPVEEDNDDLMQAVNVVEHQTGPDHVSLDDSPVEDAAIKQATNTEPLLAQEHAHDGSPVENDVPHEREDADKSLVKDDMAEEANIETLAQHEQAYNESLVDDDDDDLGLEANVEPLAQEDAPPVGEDNMSLVQAARDDAQDESPVRDSNTSGAHEHEDNESLVNKYDLVDDEAAYPESLSREHAHDASSLADDEVVVEETYFESTEGLEQEDLESNDASARQVEVLIEERAVVVPGPQELEIQGEESDEHDEEEEESRAEEADDADLVQAVNVVDRQTGPEHVYNESLVDDDMVLEAHDEPLAREDAQDESPVENDVPREREDADKSLVKDDMAEEANTETLPQHEQAYNESLVDDDDDTGLEAYVEPLAQEEASPVVHNMSLVQAQEDAQDESSFKDDDLTGAHEHVYNESMLNKGDLVDEAAYPEPLARELDMSPTREQAFDESSPVEDHDDLVQATHTESTAQEHAHDDSSAADYDMVQETLVESPEGHEPEVLKSTDASARQVEVIDEGAAVVPGPQEQGIQEKKKWKIIDTMKGDMMQFERVL